MHADARFVGGRSGGPATAVATGMAYGAASADLGGTLRLPAAYSGTVGLMASRVRARQQLQTSKSVLPGLAHARLHSRASVMAGHAACWARNVGSSCMPAQHAVLC